MLENIPIDSTKEVYYNKFIIYSRKKKNDK